MAYLCGVQSGYIGFPTKQTFPFHYFHFCSAAFSKSSLTSYFISNMHYTWDF